MTTPLLLEDFVRRTLRTWAVANLVYCAALGVLVLWWIPWKTPWINRLVLVVACGFGIAGGGLWMCKRWAWRLAVGLCLAGTGMGLAAVVGLLMSSVYLYGIYGDFGYGTAIACLGIAMLAFQLLGLFPSLELRALWRREVRAYFNAPASMTWLWRAGSCVVGCAVVAAYATGWMPTDQGFSEKTRRASVQALHRALWDKAEKPPAALNRISLDDNALYLTLWHQGRHLYRFETRAKNLGQAILHLARQIGAHRTQLPALQDIDFRFDYVVGSRSIWTGIRPLLAMSLRPGVDGLRSKTALKERILLPDDFIRADVFGAAPLVPGIAELRLGFDVGWALRQLEVLKPTWIERVRVQSWLGKDGHYRAIFRGNTAGPRASKRTYREAAVRGGDFVLAHITPERRFNYVYLPYEDIVSPGSGYSLARHAGTVYSLTVLYRHTGLDRFRQGALATLDWLMSSSRRPCMSHNDACLIDEGTATLGTAALSAIAALEYQASTGDTQFSQHARGLLRFILQMQTMDGDFRHFYDAESDAVDESAKTMFYSEEAALALVLGHRILGDAAFLTAAARALDFLTGQKYRFFVGWFIYGADHWTCIAAEEAWPHLRHRQYLDFCQGYAAFLRRLQYESGQWDNWDFQGHYGFGSMLVPQVGAAAGFTEALISTYQLSRYHGQQDTRLLRQINSSLGALLREQIRSDNSYLAKAPPRAIGGFRRSLVESDTRIDFTQHALSALIRGAQLP